MTTKNKKTNFNFESALSSLEQIVEELEDGDMGLDVSIEKFEKGMALVKACEEKLDEASGRVEKIMKDLSGEITTTPLDANTLNNEE